MSIAVSFRPLSALWSDIEFRFELSYTGMSVDKQIQVQFLDYDTNEVIANAQYPCTGIAGTIVIYQANELVAHWPQYALPTNLIGTVAERRAPIDITTIQRKKFYLRFRPSYPGSSEAWTSDLPNMHYLIKGGIDDMRFNQENYTNQFGYTKTLFFPGGSNYLTWVPEKRFVSPEEYGWITYMSDSATSGGSVTYLVNYIDGTSASINVPLPNNTGNMLWKLYMIPCGVAQCALDTAGKGVKMFTVRVNRGGLPSYTFYVDYRPDYNSMVLYYRNGMGGLDHIRLRGTIERMGGSFEKKQYMMPRRLATEGERQNYDSNGTLKFKAHTGYISKQHKAALFDLFNANYAALRYYDRFLPLYIPPQEMKAVSTEDDLHNVQIEFETAGSFRHFPRQLLDLL